MTIVWLAEAADHDHVVFRIGREADRLIARWAHLGTLRTSRDGRDWSWEVEPNADPALVQKLHTGTMRALLRHLRGEVTLHASAVAARGAAVAFAGDSGAGKSTLAFELAARAGEFELLSDDCLCVDGDLAMPSETSSWIDAADGKAPTAPTRVGAVAVPLRAIVHLVYGPDVSVRTLRGGAAAAVLGRSLIRFALDDAEVHRSDLDHLANIAERVDVLELARPKGLEHIAATLEIIDELSRALR